MIATIRLSDEIYRRIELVLAMTFQSQGERQPDGTWVVPVRDWAWEELQREKREGESDEDTLVRLIEDTARELLRDR